MLKPCPHFFLFPLTLFAISQLLLHQFCSNFDGKLSNFFFLCNGKIRIFLSLFRNGSKNKMRDQKPFLQQPPILNKNTSVKKSLPAELFYFCWNVIRNKDSLTTYKSPVVNIYYASCKNGVLESCDFLQHKDCTV